VALWLVIDPCVNFGRVYCDFWYIYFIPQFFLRHQTMDKVQKYNSFNTNIKLNFREIGCNYDVWNEEEEWIRG
jgi:hypothetical protein